MSPPIIEVSHLSKRYRLGQFNAGTLREEAEQLWRRVRRKEGGAPVPASRSSEFWALNDVSFSVERGEVVGIIGRNGAGKSTLLKILSRVTEPTRGEARIRGRLASLLEVGTGFHPELTGRENIFLNGAILGMTRAEVKAKFDEIVEFADVERFLDTPVKRYSSGMYVRLAFAVAAHLEPEVLIVDEVLAVGDADFQLKCLGRMREVSERDGRTVLFVSHNLAAIEALCPRAILLDSGQLTRHGAAPEILQSYLRARSQSSASDLAAGKTRYIRDFRIWGPNGSDLIQVGESVTFEILLATDRLLEFPRLDIGIYTPRGDRIATVHTDVQHNHCWPFSGRLRLRAIWDNLPLNAGDYRVDVNLWGYNEELEALVGCGTLRVSARDVYGTGKLPDPKHHGYLVPQARWEIDTPATKELHP